MELKPEVLGRLTKPDMQILYNTFVSKAKTENKYKKGEYTPPKSQFSGSSRFGGNPISMGLPKFTPKSFVNKPNFVTQHKGGGGK